MQDKHIQCPNCGKKFPKNGIKSHEWRVHGEVKGWKREKDEAKWKAFPEKLLILSGTDLQNLGIISSIKKDWKY